MSTSTGSNFVQSSLYAGNPVSSTSANATPSPFIDASHLHIHQGISYHVDFITGSMPANTTAYFYFVPTSSASSPKEHMSISYSTSAACQLTLYEGNTITTSGSIVPTFNRNRNSSNVSHLSTFMNTVSGSGASTGSILVQTWSNGTVPGFLGNNNTSRGICEWILATGSNYLICVSGSGIVSVELDWYEV
jgi:hypothetical protein